MSVLCPPCCRALSRIFLTFITYTFLCRLLAHLTHIMISIKITSSKQIKKKHYYSFAKKLKQ
ncbi:hypothetical protein HanIR_Chr13g0662271 [Helianthus annuus]|nr:hypothetical protein HanIR_Chr13g0662271 [Helianthus annuus]